MAQVIAIGQPVNDAERRAIAHLRDHLPAEYRVVHNFELPHEGRWFEVDLAVLAPHAVYVVDSKGTYGEIHVAAGQWHPRGRAPFASPLPLLRNHAKRLKELIVGTPPRPDLSHLWVEPLVLLAAPDAYLVDPAERDQPNVVTLDECVRRFQDPSKLPVARYEDTRRHVGAILGAIQGKARPSRGLPLFAASWQCEERLGATDAYSEYRARNVLVPDAPPVRVRVYVVDPYLPEAERDVQERRLANAYAALSRLPPHPAVPGARAFFPTEGRDGFVLVTDETPGLALRLHLTRPDACLTADQKLTVARDLLAALTHCHHHGVVHRGLSPSAILVGQDGHARLSDFDLARHGSDPRTHTVAGEVPERLEPAYLAPELFADPAKAGPPADVYAAGVALHELWVGERPWEALTEAVDAGCHFPRLPSQAVPGLPDGFDTWLQGLCAEDPAARPTAPAALTELERLFRVGSSGEPAAAAVLPDYRNLAPGTSLRNGKYQVEKRLGKPGGFGVVYKVVDTIGDVARALKIVVTDRTSTFERMRQEYRALLRVPRHPHVVQVVDGDFLTPEGPPYLVFEYVEGTDVRELLETRRLSLPEARQLGLEASEGLAHLHAHRLTHGDIKPGNLLWTDTGVKLIDFNVAILAGDPDARGGGSRRYLPPDLDAATDQSEAERVERDLYALGVTLYEVVTGRYPWPDAEAPPAGVPPTDPRTLTVFENLASDFAKLLLRAISPRRNERFRTAREFAAAVRGIAVLRQADPERERTMSTQSWAELSAAGGRQPNSNPFVHYLLTLYSQSRVTNAGTRGLDAMARKLYVETALDRALAPAVLAGDLRLAIVTGNAGDGKTAFLLVLEDRVRAEGGEVAPAPGGNGGLLRYGGRTVRTNYDGSQDEGDKANDAVLAEFFAPYAGNDPGAWPTAETRLVAINEGRLVDFLEQHQAQFPALRDLVRHGQETGRPGAGVAVVNLSLRSVVAPAGGGPPLFARVLARLVEPRFWAPCAECDLRDRCYVQHNVRTLQDAAAGQQVVERLGLLYRLAELRGTLHITLRDLRSALARMLAGTRTCAEIHELYAAGDRQAIADGFYFNSWLGGPEEHESDRVLRLLREMDVGRVNEPKLDRAFGLCPPRAAPLLMAFEGRGTYDREILASVYAGLPMEWTSRSTRRGEDPHAAYVAMLRRRHFFESRDDSWRTFVPFRAAGRMLELLDRPPEPLAAAQALLPAINRGEGVADRGHLRGKLVLQVRRVDGGLLRSYRVFPGERFRLEVVERAKDSPFIEHAPTGLVLRYAEPGIDLVAELAITLDVLEMLDRLDRGYRPTVEELQGYYLSLAVFKNVLSAAPYQEVVLTATGHEFYAVAREVDGTLRMSVFDAPEEAATDAYPG